MSSCMLSAQYISTIITPQARLIILGLPNIQPSPRDTADTQELLTQQMNVFGHSPSKPIFHFLNTPSFFSLFALTHSGMPVPPHPTPTTSISYLENSHLPVKTRIKYYLLFPTFPNSLRTNRMLFIIPIALLMTLPYNYCAVYLYVLLSTVSSYRAMTDFSILLPP